MNPIVTKMTSLLTGMMVILMLALPQQVIARASNEKPSPGAMVADAVVARPLLLAVSVLGTGLYVISLPVSLLGGNAKEAAQALVLKPWENTVLRCLGCQHVGR